MQVILKTVAGKLFSASRSSKDNKLPLATFLVGILGSCLMVTSVSANTPPSFPQIENRTFKVGELSSFTVRPVDPDNTVPGSFMLNAPEGAEFIDNRDGSRSFSWTPQAYQTGEHRVLFVAIDAFDQSLRYSQEVFITVVAETAAAPSPEVENPVQPVNPEPTDIATDPAVPEAPVTVVDGNQFPVIDLPSSINLLPMELAEIRVAASDPDGGVPGLLAHALPAGADFRDNRDGTRSIVWTPTQWQTGNFDVVIVAIDPERNDHRSQKELRLVVGAELAPEPEPAPTVVEPEPTNPEPPLVTSPPAPAPIVQPTPVVDVQPDPVPEAELRPDLPGNQAPYFAGLTNQTVSLGQTLRFVVAPKDPDGDVPGMFADRLPYNSSFRDNFDGTRTLIWRPFPVDKGDFWIKFTAVDSKDVTLRSHQSIKITVEDNGGYNFEPVINGINNPVIRVGDTLRQIVQPVDPDGDVPKLSVLNPPPGASFVDNQDGTRTLLWTVGQEHITEWGDVDNPHTVDFLAVDARDDRLRDDHQLKISVVQRDSRNRPGERLRTLAERRGLLVGFAAMLESTELADTDIYLDIASEEFNIITPENSHKWGWIQPERGVFRFEDADAMADYAVEHGMVLHGHPLLWHRQLPGWVQNMPLEEAEQIMYEHIDALVNRYRGKVGIWDVVNEALEEDGTYRKSVWYEAMGEGYISKAFHRARQMDPDAVLVYNDYDVSWPGPKADGMYELIKKELAAGTPIDAVGFQMHFWTAFDGYDILRDNLQRFADLGIDIYITEFDVAFTAQGQEELQASVYEKIAQICLEQPRCRALQAWGFTDRYSWRYRNKPLLFTERYHAKPAYFAWQRALGN